MPLFRVLYARRGSILVRNAEDSDEACDAAHMALMDIEIEDVDEAGEIDPTEEGIDAAGYLDTDSGG